MLKFGHRGASFNAPENTISAIQQAFKLGADGVEVDIQMTLDNKIILLHDDTLKRTATYTKKLQEKTGLTKEIFEKIVSTPISQLNYNEIKDIDVGLWKSNKWTQERVPKLKSVLQLLFSPKNPIKKIQIEIKGKDIFIIPQLKKVLLKYPKKFISDTIILIGFDLETMKFAKQEIPYCKAMLVESFKKSSPPHNLSTNISKIIHAALDGIDFEANPTLVTQEIVQEAHKHKKLIGTWVYPEQDTLENMLYFEKIGINFHTTNLPPEITNQLLSRENFN